MTPITKERTDALLVECGRAINRNNGRCRLIEDALVRVTGYCCDALSLLEEAAALREQLAAWKADHALLQANVAFLAGEVNRLQVDNRLHRCKVNGEYWTWQGDGEDYLESLVCPVLMRADDVRSFVAAGVERDRFRVVLQSIATGSTCYEARREAAAALEGSGA